MTKIVVTDYIEPDLKWEEDELGKLEGVEFEYHQLKFAPQDELIAAVRDADVIVVNMSPFPAEVIEALDNCKLIIRHGIGYDNVDPEACTRRGIRLANIPDYCATEVAEHAMALLLACVRKVMPGRKLLEDCSAAGNWDFTPLGKVFRFEGKTVGIVGCGRIGGRVYRMLGGFGVKRMVVDPYIDNRQMGALGITETYTLDEMLPQADFVTIHTPLNDETRGMFDEPQFKLMKETAYLINTARAGMIVTAALIKACKEGWIAGAGIDVYDQEPPPPDLELFDLPNVTLAPHMGWASEEAGWAIRVKILDDIRAYLRGEPPRYTVNEDVEEVLGGKAYRT